MTDIVIELGPGSAAAARAEAAAVNTAADRVQTGLDATATAADRVQTGLDATATAADRVQTGLDATATAADRVQTGLDATATATSAGTAATHAGTATTQAGIATTQASTATTQAGIATTQAGIATTKADEAAASAAGLDTLFQFGTNGPESLSAAAGYLSPGLYVRADPLPWDATIYEIELTALAAVTIKIGLFSQSGDDFTRDIAWTDVALSTGSNTVALDISGTEGQLVGFWVPTASRIGRTIVSENPEGGGYYYTATDTNPFTDASATTTVQIEAAVRYKRRYVTTDRVAAAEGEITDLSAAFVTDAPVNLFDPTLAEDQKSLNLGSGAAVALTYRGWTGKQAVEPGKTYTVKMGHWVGFSATQRFVCYSGAGSYMGIDQSNGVNTVATNPPTGITWTGYNEVTFSIPSGSGIRYMAINFGDWHDHDTADFDAIVESIQWQEGASATALERPVSASAYARLRPEHLPAADFTPFVQPSDTQIVVHRDGDTYYIRRKWTDTLDVIDAFGVGVRADTAYMPNFGGDRTAARTNYNTPEAWSSQYTSRFVIEPDDVGPLNFGGTYLGANHGCDDALSVPATGHGKALEDVGSTWQDGGGRRFVLMAIIDANTLHFLSENQSTYPEWSFHTTMTGPTLTHVSDATNTGSITIGSATSLQINPGSSNIEIAYLADGAAVPDAQPILADKFVARLRYRVNNPASMVAYAVANVGSSTELDYTDSSIDADAVDEITYTWSAGRAVAIARSVTLLNDVDYGHTYAAQAVRQQVTGSELLYGYVPRMDALATGETFSDEEDINALAANRLLTSTYYADAGNPPLSVAQIVKDGSDRVRSFALGLVPGYGTAVDRASNSDRVGVFAGGSQKQYLSLSQTDTAESAGTSWDALAYRGLTNLSGDASAREQFWFWSGASVIVVLDYHAAVTYREIILPDAVAGAPITVLENSGLTIHNGDHAGPYGIAVSGAGAARAVLKIG